MISVIIPTWNDFEWLPTCLESLAKQKVEKEIIIVDDGSIDNTKKKLRKKITTPYIYRGIKHQGVCKACNEGFKLSKGEYVLFADADMAFGGDCLKTMLKALKDNPDCAFAFCDSVWTDTKGNRGSVVQDLCWDPERLKKNNYIDKCSLMRREAFVKFGGFDESLERLVDWDMWLTFVEKGMKGVHIPRELYIKILRPDGISNRSQEDFLRWRATVMEKHNLCQMLPSLQ